MTRVSVVVVNYNGAHLLPECLGSLASQDYSDLEVLVVDNGSIDESAAVAASYPCRFVPLQANAGLPAAYNRGAELASGEYLFFVNNDMRFDTGCVRRLAEALDAETSTFAADPLQYNWDGTAVIHARSVLEPAATMREAISAALIPLPPLKMNFTAPASIPVVVPWGCAGSLMVRRRFFEALGGWDESFFLDMEDMDLCWRSWLRGWATVFVPDARLYHKWGASNDEPLLAAKSEQIRRRLERRDFARITGQQRNHLRFASKVLDPLSVLALIAMKLTALVAMVPRRPRVALAMARALAGFMLDIPALVAARIRIAGTATCTSRALIERFAEGEPHSGRVPAPPEAVNQRRGFDLLCAAALLLGGLMFIAPALAAGAPLGRYPSDGTRIHYFTREFASRELAHLQLPLWNPYTQFGAPFLANMQWGVLSPLNLVLFRLPSDVGYNVFIVLSLVLAGVSMFSLGRDWKLSRPAALVASLAFMWSGRLVSWASGGALYMLSAIAWLPFVLLAFTRVLDARRRRGAWMAVTALAAAMQIVSGHPQITFFTACVVGAFVVDRLLERPRQWWPLAAAAIVATLAIGLSAVQLAPTYEAMRWSTRAFTWNVSSSPGPIEGSYNPIRLVTWLVPDLFGNTVSLRPAATDWLSLVLREVHSDEFRGYVGVLPLVLACFSLTQWRLERRVAVLWTLIAGSVLLALGRFTPLYVLMYRILPPLRTFRIPARFLTISVFAVALLAGFGVDAVIRAPRERLARWCRGLAILAGTLVVCAAVGAAVRAPLMAHARSMAAPLFAARPAGASLDVAARAGLIERAFSLSVRSTLLSAGLVAAAACIFALAAASGRARQVGAAVVLLTVFDLGLQASMYTVAEPMDRYFARNAPLTERLYEQGPIVREYTVPVTGPTLQADAVSPSDNVFMHDQLLTGSGYDSFELATYRQAADLINRELRRGSPLLARLFGLRYIVSYESLPTPSFVRVGDLGVAGLYENTGALPRFYVAAHGRRVAGAAEAFAMLQDDPPTPGRDVLLESPLPLAPDGRVEATGRVSIERLTSDETRLEVRTDGAAYLVANDSYYPGWIATVDGTPVPILRANGHVRAIHVPAGNHQVTMRFEPDSLKKGARISLAFVLITMFIAMFPGRARARPDMHDRPLAMVRTA